MVPSFWRGVRSSRRIRWNIANILNYAQQPVVRIERLKLVQVHLKLKTYRVNFKKVWISKQIKSVKRISKSLLLLVQIDMIRNRTEAIRSHVFLRSHLSPQVFLSNFTKRALSSGISRQEQTTLKKTKTLSIKELVKSG